MMDFEPYRHLDEETNFSKHLDEKQLLCVYRGQPSLLTAHIYGYIKTVVAFKHYCIYYTIDLLHKTHAYSN